MQGAWRGQGAPGEGRGACLLGPACRCLQWIPHSRLVCRPPPAPHPYPHARPQQMASMLEGGGKTPMLTPAQLQGMGFKLCAYPLSLLGVSVRAMEVALQGLKDGRVPAPPAMPTFPELQAGGVARCDDGGGARQGTARATCISALTLGIALPSPLPASRCSCGLPRILR